MSSEKKPADLDSWLLHEDQFQHKMLEHYDAIRGEGPDDEEVESTASLVAREVRRLLHAHTEALAAADILLREAESFADTGYAMFGEDKQLYAAIEAYKAVRPK